MDRKTLDELRTRTPWVGGTGIIVDAAERDALFAYIDELERGHAGACRLIGAIAEEQGGTLRIQPRSLQSVSADAVVTTTRDPHTGAMVIRVSAPEPQPGR